MSVPQYSRILVKLSGEALMADSGFGICIDVVNSFVLELKALYDQGIEIAMVVGGGNIIRGAELASHGVERTTADHMGMLATVINALAMQDSLERVGIYARVMSAIDMNQVCEDYIRRRAMTHLRKKRVVIFASGTGNPFFTTDTAASLRAIEIGADLLIKATKVDGVYSHDPMLNDQAMLYPSLDYDQVIQRKLDVMDATAIVLCRDHKIPLRVLNIRKPGTLLRAVYGENEGTLVSDMSKNSDKMSASYV